MASTLTGQPVQDTYDCLIKIGDNQPLSATLKVLSDGVGNELPVQVNTSQVSITGTLDTTSGLITVAAPTQGNHATTRTYVDTEIGNEETARITADAALQTQINTNASDITDLQNVDATIFAWTLDGLNLSDSIDIQGAGGISVTNNGNNIITIDGSAVAGDVNSVNTLVGDITVVSTDADLLTVSVDAVNNEIELNPILPRTMLEDVKNVSGGALTKGMALHVTGSTGNEAEVIKADASLGLAAHLILNEDLPNNLDTGKAVAIGFINNVSVPDTTNFQAGTEVYLGNGGGFTHLKPTGSSIVQYLGMVLNASTPSGAGTVSGIIQNLGVENQLPNLPQGYVWRGGTNDVPTAVDTNTLYVAYATTAGSATTSTNAQYADDAANVKVDAITSGTYRLLVSDTGVGAGAYTRAKSDVADGLTFNTTGDVLSTGAFTATNNVTAGGALIGASLDISGSADIDGTLTLGAIGNVEGEINDLNTFVANFEEFSPIVNETTSITMDDVNYSTYKGKTIIITSATAVDVELDFTSAPVTGDEFYVVQGGAGAIGVINYGGSVNSAAGSAPTTRAQWSGAVFKYLGSGNWLVMGDIE